MDITTDMIKELRVATNAGVLDCRKALQESNGDFQKAVDWLREKGMATAANAPTAMLRTVQLNCILTAAGAWA